MGWRKKKASRRQGNFFAHVDERTSRGEGKADARAGSEREEQRTREETTSSPTAKTFDASTLFPVRARHVRK